MSIAAPLLCAWRDENSIRPACSARAVRQRLEAGGTVALYFCADHALPTDRAILTGAPVRLVTLQCSVTFTGSSCARGAAEVEARSRLQLACLGAGGLVEVQTVTSTPGRIRAPRPAYARRDEQPEG